MAVTPDAPTVTSPADNDTLALTSGVDFAWTHNDPDSDPQAAWAIKRRSADLPSDMDSGLQYGSEEWWSDTAQDVLSGPTTIDTSTAATATAYSNQRKVDRCQNGVLWAMFDNGETGFGVDWEFHYSTDDGETWALGGSFASGSARTYTGNGSFFIDLDDYAHAVYKDHNDGYIYYRRGTPNAGRTSWTWSAATAVRSNTSGDFPDIVAHREGTGWMAHIVLSFLVTSPGTANGAGHYPLTITSGGAVSLGSIGTLGLHSRNSHTYPSIDFNHTGDGKTVAGGTPHLYAAWSTGGSGGGDGIRFKKATYSGGSWTWGTEREIDNTRYVFNTNYWLNCLFDGTRVILVGSLTGSSYDVMLYERDSADTVTTTRLLLDDQDASAGAVAAQPFITGSATYDGNGDVYISGRFNESSTAKVGYRKWVRATTALDPVVVIDVSANFAPYVSAKRGFSNGRIEFIYTDGTTSPYNVTYGSIIPRTANTWGAGPVTNAGTASSKTITDWPADADTYQYAIATADALGGLGAYTAWRNLNPWEFWNGSAWVPMAPAYVVTATTEATFGSADFEQGMTYQWTVATEDTGGADSPYATLRTFSIGGFERWGAVFI